MVRNRGRVTRFVVMAVLQAARASTLGLLNEAAYSWGLNRAIFYAAARSGFRGGGSNDAASGSKPGERPAGEVYRLGGEEAFRDPNAETLTFVIGGEPQTSAEFDRQVTARFGTPQHFQAAWEEAMTLLQGFDRATLESRSQFFDEVYRPCRDELSDRWTEQYSPPVKPKA